MRRILFVALLVGVAAISYHLGRRQAGLIAEARSAAPSQVATNVSNEPVLSAGRSRNESASSRPAGMDRHAPFAQNLTSAERGYQAARENLDAALAAIGSLPVPERMGFTTGIFSFVAQNYSPEEALKVFQRVPESFQPNALRALVAEWVFSQSPLDEDQRHIRREGVFTISGSRLGLEVELASMLASAGVGGEIATAYLEAFSRRSDRSELLLAFSGSLGRDNPEAVLARTEGWTEWEKERVTRRVLSNWAASSPKDAWAWYQGNRGRFEQDFSSSILGAWAASDLDGVQGLLNSTTDAAQRKVAIDVIGRTFAQKNTDDAVTWANGFAESSEKEAANRAVYEGAPRGIGAVLASEKGFPSIRGILPGSPLEGSGIAPGDQLIELTEAGGRKEALYARDLATTVNLIRGEPGTEVMLRVLRQNKESGQLEEHQIAIKRGQLYFNEKSPGGK